MIKITEDELLEILSLKDCVTNVILLKYASKNNLKKVVKAIKGEALDLKKAGSRSIDRNWLLIYQIWTEKDLEGKGQGFLAILKKKNFDFFDDSLFE